MSAPFCALAFSKITNGTPTVSPEVNRTNKVVCKELTINQAAIKPIISESHQVLNTNVKIKNTASGTNICVSETLKS